MAADAPGAPYDPHPIDRSLIGTSSEPFEVEIERGAIVKFANAIGDPNQLYRDGEYARSHGYHGVLAPPTFAVSFLPPIEPRWWHSIDRKRILAGEQSFRYHRPIVAGDRLTCRVHLVDVTEKTGRSGKMEFIIQENRGIDRMTEEPVFVHRRVAVYRAPGNHLANG